MDAEESEGDRIADEREREEEPEDEMTIDEILQETWDRFERQR
jgi:hypothetical protein